MTGSTGEEGGSWKMGERWVGGWVGRSRHSLHFTLSHSRLLVLALSQFSALCSSYAQVNPFSAHGAAYLACFSGWLGVPLIARVE